MHAFTPSGISTPQSVPLAGDTSSLLPSQRYPSPHGSREGQLPSRSLRPSTEVSVRSTSTSRARAALAQQSRESTYATTKDLGSLELTVRRLETRVNELDSRVQYVNPWAVQYMWEILCDLRQQLKNTRYGRYAYSHRSTAPGAEPRPGQPRAFTTAGPPLGGAAPSDPLTSARLLNFSSADEQDAAGRGSMSSQWMGWDGGSGDDRETLAGEGADAVGQMSPLSSEDGDEVPTEERMDPLARLLGPLGHASPVERGQSSSSLRDVGVGEAALARGRSRTRTPRRPRKESTLPKEHATGEKEPPLLWMTAGWQQQILQLQQQEWAGRLETLLEETTRRNAVLTNMIASMAHLAPVPVARQRHRARRPHRESDRQGFTAAPTTTGRDGESSGSDTSHSVRAVPSVPFPRSSDGGNGLSPITVLSRAAAGEKQHPSSMFSPSTVHELTTGGSPGCEQNAIDGSGRGRARDLEGDVGLGSHGRRRHSRTAGTCGTDSARLVDVIGSCEVAVAEEAAHPQPCLRTTLTDEEVAYLASHISRNAAAVDVLMDAVGRRICGEAPHSAHGHGRSASATSRSSSTASRESDSSRSVDPSRNVAATGSRGAVSSGLRLLAEQVMMEVAGREEERWRRHSQHLADVRLKQLEDATEAAWSHLEQKVRDTVKKASRQLRVERRVAEETLNNSAVAASRRLRGDIDRYLADMCHRSHGSRTGGARDTGVAPHHNRGPSSSDEDHSDSTLGRKGGKKLGHTTPSGIGPVDSASREAQEMRRWLRRVPDDSIGLSPTRGGGSPEGMAEPTTSPEVAGGLGGSCGTREERQALPALVRRVDLLSLALHRVMGTLERAERSTASAVGADMAVLRAETAARRDSPRRRGQAESELRGKYDTLASAVSTIGASMARLAARLRDIEAQEERLAREWQELSELFRTSLAATGARQSPSAAPTPLPPAPSGKPHQKPPPGAPQRPWQAAPALGLSASPHERPIEEVIQWVRLRGPAATLRRGGAVDGTHHAANPHRDRLEALCAALQQVNHVYNVDTDTFGSTLQLILALPPDSLPPRLARVCREFLAKHSVVALQESIEREGPSMPPRGPDVLLQCVYWMQSHVVATGGWVRDSTNSHATADPSTPRPVPENRCAASEPAAVVSVPRTRSPSPCSSQRQVERAAAAPPAPAWLPPSSSWQTTEGGASGGGVGGGAAQVATWNGSDAAPQLVLSPITDLQKLAVVTPVRLVAASGPPRDDAGPSHGAAVPPASTAVLARPAPPRDYLTPPLPEGRHSPGSNRIRPSSRASSAEGGDVAAHAPHRLPPERELAVARDGGYVANGDPTNATTSPRVPTVNTSHCASDSATHQLARGVPGPSARANTQRSSSFYDLHLPCAHAISAFTPPPVPAAASQWRTSWAGATTASAGREATRGEPQQVQPHRTRQRLDPTPPTWYAGHVTDAAATPVPSCQARYR